jgi:dihydrofolate reductase
LTISQNISLIVAMAANNAIGKDNKLLFHLPGDLKRFKSITTGHTIIMGRKTLLSLPKWPLPNRRHIVLTSNPDVKFTGCETVSCMEEALNKIKGEKEAFVIGGGSVYRQFYPLAGKLYLTLVHKEFDADTYFPGLDYAEWEQLRREDHHDEKNEFDYSYIDLRRRC